MSGHTPWSEITHKTDTHTQPSELSKEIDKINEAYRQDMAERTKGPLPADAAARKLHPITTGVLDYFPDALAAVARVSYMGNQQHNPGEPLHWARGKSMDHADCIGRHLIERGTVDVDGGRHSAKLAWRALALLQLELEALDQSTRAVLAPPTDQFHPGEYGH